MAMFILGLAIELFVYALWASIIYTFTKLGIYADGDEGRKYPLTRRLLAWVFVSSFLVVLLSGAAYAGLGAWVGEDAAIVASSALVMLAYVKLERRFNQEVIGKQTLKLDELKLGSCFTLLGGMCLAIGLLTVFEAAIAAEVMELIFEMALSGALIFIASYIPSIFVKISEEMGFASKKAVSDGSGKI